MAALASLATLPEGVAETLEVTAGFDQCLASGFSRLTSEDREHLDSFTAIFAATPLGEAVAQASGQVQRSEFVTGAFLTLAAGRASLLGAVHDALLAQATEAFAETVPASPEPGATPPSGEYATLQSSTQQWLLELAVTGFFNLEETHLTPFSATLEQIQEIEELSGLSALLTGALQEWLHLAASETKDSSSLTRWVDLWSAAMLGAQSLTPAEGYVSVAGSFYPCGVDVRSHTHVVQATIYGWLQTANGLVPVRLPFSSYRVNVVAGDEIWKLFSPEIDPFIEALEQRKELKLTKAELAPSGVLRLLEAPKVGGAVDLFAIAGEAAGLFAPIIARNRHPIHLIQLVHFPECKVTIAKDKSQGTISVEGVELPLALERMPLEGELSLTLLKSTVAMIGLLRFDRGSWRVQPLAIQSSGSKATITVISGEGIGKKLASLKANTLETLQERAEKLLRE